MAISSHFELTSTEYADVYDIDADALEALIGTDPAELSADDLESIAALDDLDVVSDDFCGAFAGFLNAVPF